ncbi:MAG: DUF488 domain-containing protein [Actinobacteria bacterium]|nr:DUF488 domain-containing protein [Actinomycetota bacterium]MBW3643518.1 DUF488 domain-containing protein [Actinomycetota bacterium]
MDLIRTVGHGTLGPDELVALLEAAGVDAVADVRRYPGSRRHPHVGREAMEGWLPGAGIEYRWIRGLGGRRPVVAGSRHVALRNGSFRAYADHMVSSEFAGGLAELSDIVAERSVAVMCSESLWWRCHRRLLADHLVLIGHIPVEHLFHDGRSAPHLPTPGARVEADLVVYDTPHLGVPLPLDGLGPHESG